jgi:hypothetical protein
METPEEKLTRQQQKALHLFFTLLAEELNNAGLDQRKVLKPGVAIPWSGESIKTQIWKPIQQALYEKKSTTELLKKEEIDRVYNVINKHLSESFPGIEIPDFPSIESIIQKQKDYANTL